jgi:glycerol-3-phosphate dehydrogenase
MKHNTGGIKDVVIIGAGAVGAAIARELAKYELKILLVDKNEDIGGDASKSNSAIIHTGYDASPGTLESSLVVAANPMYDKFCEELEIPFKRTGAILVAVTQEEFELLPAIGEKSRKNGVDDIELLAPETIRELEPNVTDKALGGILIPRESIIDPFLLVIAQAESAVINGVEIMTSAKVTGLKKDSGNAWVAETTKGAVRTKYVINAAGLGCEEIARLAGKCDFKMHPRKGQFFILDKNVNYRTQRIILPVPTKLTKGKLAAPTIHGNMLIGPTAEDIADFNDKSVTQAGMDEVIKGVQKLLPAFNPKDAITEYAGLRPTRTPEGYFIEAYRDLKGFINITGIRSTGVTASLAIAKYAADLLRAEGLQLSPNKNFRPKRQAIPKFCECCGDVKESLVKKDRLFGKVICRCETVTEAEIVAAIRAPAGARSVDAIKRRVRAGMGRCQGGFCGPRVIEILARELKIKPGEVRKHEAGSEFITGETR